MSLPKSRRYCSVYGCLNNGIQNPELSFFNIPLESERRIQWLQLISREDLIPKSTHNRVCETHFDPQDIRITTRKILVQNCVPSLNLPKKSKGDKETQTNVETRVSASQTDTEYSNAGNQTERTYWVSANETQTPASLSANTPQMKKLKAELRECRSLLKTAEKHASNKTERTFLVTDNETQTPASLFVGTSRKRKKSDLKCVKRRKIVENGLTGNYQNNMYHELCVLM